MIKKGVMTSIGRRNPDRHFCGTWTNRQDNILSSAISERYYDLLDLPSALNSQFALQSFANRPLLNRPTPWPSMSG
jgi:hypothetical protein